MTKTSSSSSFSLSVSFFKAVVVFLTATTLKFEPHATAETVLPSKNLTFLGSMLLISICDWFPLAQSCPFSVTNNAA